MQLGTDFVEVSTSLDPILSDETRRLFDQLFDAQGGGPLLRTMTSLCARMNSQTLQCPFVVTNSHLNGVPKETT
ncbi:hypothetical protein JQ617_24690 [Bradyrhizobium sp. KB893862 SZCCT0404]|uniref:hypothetical protein n=1 Tax=Bradyrhizobium sp. KB893862 SZCCT0404 TaxID=2807672 RepID=UPI001BAD2BA2|nr:hypothetical protein [Bradyrhizobium sp. KB893862 SZCCT0404]MBR1177173.1 hypothetical protein [Bradyrhizobium sp. KB893862 SZCCT0404]